MQITELKNENLAREYSVKVDADTLNKEYEAQLKSVGTKVKIPGFRPGHVPFNILKQRYGKSVLGDVLENTVNRTSADVIKEKGLKPALPPKISIVTFEEGQDLEYTMALEVLPLLPELDFGKVKIDRMSYELPATEVKEALDRIAQGNKDVKELPAGTAAKKGNVLNIDFTGYLKDEAFEGGAAKGVNLELGSNTFIPGFEEQLEGLKAGDEKRIKVTFPESYHKEDLRGQPAEFEVKVNSVQESVAAELNDDFAKKLGFDSFEKLEGVIRQQIEKEYNQLVRSHMKKQLLDQLDKEYKFDVPQRMLELEFDAIWKQVEQAKQAGEEGLDKPEDELRKEYQAIAERRVRLGLLLSEVSSKNKIGVSQEELSMAILEQARMFPGQEKAVFDYYRQSPQHLDELRGPLLEEKAVDYVMGQAKITDKPTTLEELKARKWEDA
jgi:trigger factor